MPIKIKSSGGGSVSFDVPNTGSDYTLTAPANNATIFTSAGGTVTGNVAFTSNNVTIGGNSISPIGGMRNRIINGTFDVWQRGTSFTIGGTTTYHADRWCSVQYSGSTAVFSQQTTGMIDATYCLRCQRNTGNTYTATVNVGQFIESINCKDLADKSITLSFYARAGANFSASSSILTSDIVTGTGTDQNNFTSTYTNKTDNNQNNTITTSWQRFTHTITVGSNVTEMGVQFYYIPTGTAGSSDYFEITLVQLELGSFATPFERRLYGQELALCQRYYQIMGAGLTYYNSASGQQGRVTVPIPVSIRTTSPSFTQISTGVYGNVSNYSYSLIQSNLNQLGLHCWVQSSAGAGSYTDFNAVIAINAEL